MNAVLKIKGDIVFLQDTRCGKYEKTFQKEISLTKHGNFQAFINSSKRERGVVILVNSNLNFEVINIHPSNCQNVLVLDSFINDFRLSLVCSYRPIQEKKLSFFKQLKQKLIDIGNAHFILAGDLNAIPDLTPPSNDPLLSNVDTYKMVSLPNPAHCTELKLDFDKV